MSDLAVENLSKNFGGLMAVNDISFTIESGERRAIIGPNGAGKTTLFNLLSGELRPSTGKVMLDARDITTHTTYERARLGIGRTFQRNNLFLGLTVFENVQLAIQYRQGIASNFFKPAALYDDLVRATEQLMADLGLDERADEQVSSLSYGEQRQLEVALALAIQPSVLLLDEPTAGMAPAETKSMVQMIARMPRDITLLIIEHDMDVVFDLADHITVLHYGQIIADGSPEKVKGDPRVQEVYLGADEEF